MLMLVEDGRLKVDVPRPHEGTESHYSSQTLSSSRRSVAEDEKVSILDKSCPDVAKLEEIASIQAEKIAKLQQLLSVKDAKIDALCEKLTKYGISNDSDRSATLTQSVGLSRSSVLQHS